jgi:hypothetical protein
VSRLVDLFVADGALHVQRAVTPAVVVPVDERDDLGSSVASALSERSVATIN